ncbi:MAG: glycine oxidase ThiO [Gammaproteobacteria bacterium]
MSKARVVIVGAGVIGLTSACELARRGYDVTVLDRNAPGSGSPRASGGIVCPLRPWLAHTVVDRLTAYSCLLYDEFIERLIEESGVNPGYVQSGMLVVGDTHRKAAQEWASGAGRTLEVVDRSDLTRLVPDIGRMREGVYMPNVHHLNNSLLLEALNVNCHRLGVEMLANREVTQLTKNQDVITGVETVSGQISADMVLIAAGAWSGNLMSDASLRLNVTPVRGQMIWYQDSVERSVRPIVDDGEHYVVTHSDGTTLVGGTVENVGFDHGVTDKALKRLVNKAKNLIIGLGELAPKGQWSGLRPARAHGIPLIGEHPREKGLFLNTGHFRNGVTLAPGSAVLLADIIDGRPESGVGVSTL